MGITAEVLSGTDAPLQVARVRNHAQLDHNGFRTAMEAGIEEYAVIVEPYKGRNDRKGTARASAIPFFQFPLYSLYLSLSPFCFLVVPLRFERS